MHSQYIFINLTLLQLQKILFDGTDKNRKMQIIKQSVIKTLKMGI